MTSTQRDSFTALIHFNTYLCVSLIQFLITYLLPSFFFFPSSGQICSHFFFAKWITLNTLYELAFCKDHISCHSVYCGVFNRMVCMHCIHPSRVPSLATGRLFIHYVLVLFTCRSLPSTNHVLYSTCNTDYNDNHVKTEDHLRVLSQEINKTKQQCKNIIIHN